MTALSRGPPGSIDNGWWPEIRQYSSITWLSDLVTSFITGDCSISILINHPSLVKQLLQETHRSFDKRTVIYNRFRTAFGNGLVVSEDDHWKRQRKLIQPMFGHSAIARFFPHMVDATAEMINRWELKCRAGQVFDVAREMNRITLEIVGHTLFHDSFAQAADDIQRWTHTIDRYSAKAPIPIIRDSWFPSRRNRRLKKTLQEFHGFLLRMIEAHVRVATVTIY